MFHLRTTKRALQKALPTPSLRETVESRDLRNPYIKFCVLIAHTATLNFFTARTPIYTVRRGELRKSGIRSCRYSRDRPDFSKIQKMIIFIKGKWCSVLKTRRLNSSCFGRFGQIKNGGSHTRHRRIIKIKEQLQLWNLS